MIVLFDCGVGNLKSVFKAVSSFGLEVKVSSDVQDIKKASFLIFPGQGAFAQAVQCFRDKDVLEAIRGHILQGKPYLGLCLGFQLLFEQSTENGLYEGMGIFPGKVVSFRELYERDGISGFKVPHMGWNTLQVVSDPNQVFEDESEVSEAPYLYFVHSYCVETTQEEIVSTRTEYGVSFVSSVQRDHLFATQFHPEKSGKAGLRILSRFLRYCGYHV